MHYDGEIPFYSFIFNLFFNLFNVVLHFIYLCICLFIKAVLVNVFNISYISKLQIKLSKYKYTSFDSTTASWCFVLFLKTGREKRTTKRICVLVTGLSFMLL